MRARLAAYAGLLRRWNKTHRLVSRGDLDELEARHIDDSLALVPWLQGATLVDIGAGAGLPGIPLALARPDIGVTLLERSARKARFLRQVVLELALGNAEVVGEDARRYRPLALFDTATVRAVARPQCAWRLARPFLRAGGMALLQSNAPLAPLTFPAGRLVASAPTRAAGRPPRHVTAVAAN